MFRTPMEPIGRCGLNPNVCWWMSPDLTACIHVLVRSPSTNHHALIVLSYIFLMAKTPTLWSSNMAMNNPAFNLMLFHAFPSHSNLHLVQAFPSHVWWHRWVPVGCLQTSLAWRKKALSSWYNWTSMALWAPSTCAGATRTHQPWRNRNWIWIGFCWDVF